MHCTALVVDADVYPRKPSNCAAAAPLQQQQGAAGSHALSVFQFCSRAWGVGMLPGWACMHACMRSFERHLAARRVPERPTARAPQGCNRASLTLP